MLIPGTGEGEAPALVRLDPEHPGFRDEAYLARRNAIAGLARTPSTSAPRVEYTSEEDALWRRVRSRLELLHASLACREYLNASAQLDLDRER